MGNLSSYLVNPFCHQHFQTPFETILSPMETPLKFLRSWTPFRLDALGLLTMIGSEEMSRAIGSLSPNRFLSFLALLGGNVIASNGFTEPLHGYRLYNITDAVQSSTFAGWFSRWLCSQDISENTSLFIWSVCSKSPKKAYGALAIGLIINACTTAFPVLVADYYGLASAIFMDVGILVRVYLVAQNRNAIDRGALDTSVHSGELVKTFIILANGKATTVIAPRNVLINCFLSPPRLPHPMYYTIARTIGWISFVGFVLTIGQATLVVQLVTVVVTVSATVLTAFGIGQRNDMVGNVLQVAHLEHPNTRGRRGEAYAALYLSKEEEETMVDWALFPQKRNRKWWAEYQNYVKSEGKVINIDTIGSMDSVPSGDNLNNEKEYQSYVKSEGKVINFGRTGSMDSVSSGETLNEEKLLVVDSKQV